METFSGNGNFNGGLICGVLTMWDYITKKQQKILKDHKAKGWFPKKINLDEDMKTSSSLQKIASKSSRTSIVESIGNSIIKFISENEDYVKDLHEKIDSVV
ncbi:MAG: hypothetical protein MK212_20310 [Saprospiraceae bacterium]|nr:hypothetical protein [Saprospiraceae bacterium]